MTKGTFLFEGLLWVLTQSLETGPLRKDPLQPLYDVLVWSFDHGSCSPRVLGLGIWSHNCSAASCYPLDPHTSVQLPHLPHLSLGTEGSRCLSVSLCSVGGEGGGGPGTKRIHCKCSSERRNLLMKYIVRVYS